MHIDNKFKIARKKQFLPTDTRKSRNCFLVINVSIYGFCNTISVPFTVKLYDESKLGI